MRAVNHFAEPARVPRTDAAGHLIVDVVAFFDTIEFTDLWTRVERENRAAP